jgi:hypothetical protein
LLLKIDEMVSKECRRLEMERSDYHFSRRDIRQYTGWGNTQLKTHLARLEDLEYLLVHHGGRGQSFVYELVFERSARDDKPVLPGLIDVERLSYDENRSGFNEEKSGPNRPQVGGMSGGSRGKPEPIAIGLGTDFRPFCGKNIDTGMREQEPVVIVAAGAR